MTVSVWENGETRPVMAVQAAWSALMSLQALAQFQGFLNLKTEGLPTGRPLPKVVDRAYQAARSVSGKLTPLAAVAGAAADEVADTATELGADRVIVNNGGDIALRLSGKTMADVGIQCNNEKRLLGCLKVTADLGIGGVATSGWQGRSNSPGVADIVTVWAESASLADAAATVIAAHTAISGSEIKQVEADRLDHASDLGKSLVTCHVGKLSDRQRCQALDRGRETAEILYHQGLIRGCFIYIQGNSLLMDPGHIAHI